MKQIFRYFSVLMVLFVSTMASAQSTIKVMAVTNGTVSVNKTSASWGEIVTVTVTPDEGYYFRINDLEVVKTVNPAATRGDAEIPIANVLTVYDYDPSDLSTTRTYTFQVPGDGYEIQISATFRARTPITDDMVTLYPTSFVYNGSDRMPSVSVSEPVFSNGLIQGVDYTVTFAESAWKDVGTYTIYVNGMSTYKGTVTKTFTISAADGSLTPPSGKSGLVYTGAAQDLITAGSSTTGTMQYSLDGTNYSTTIPQGTDAKEYTVYYKVVANAGYNDVDPASFKVTIAAKTVSSPTITLSETSFVYDGNAKEPTATVKDGETTIPASEYTVSYKDNTEVGTATVTITDKDGGNYTVSGSVPFSILSADGSLTPPTGKTNLIYTGSAQDLIEAGSSTTGTMQYSLDGTNYSTEIPQGTDAKEYTVYYKVVANAGYNDVAPASFKVTISPKTVNSPTITLSETSYTYDGNAKEPTVTVKDGDATIPASEYTVSYKDNTEVGTATVTITDKEGGNYTVSGSVAFSITAPETPSVVNTDESVTVDGHELYEPSKEVTEAIKEAIETDIALPQKAEGRVEVTEGGGLKFSKGEDLLVGLLDMKLRDIVKFIFTGRLFGDSSKLRLKNASTRGTRAAGDMELISEAEYEVIEAGDQVVTVKFEEGEATVETIAITESEKTPITISGAKQVTYMRDKDLDFTGYPDLKAYVATGYDKASGTIWLTRVKEVPANTGFLLMGEAGNYEIPVKAGGLSSYYQNMFKGTLEATTIYTTDGNYTNYYLSNGESGVGFYKVTKEEGVTLGKNRAYLPIPTEIPVVGTAGSTETIKVSAAGQVPYYNTESLDFSSLDAQGVKAYTATGYDYNSGTIWLTRVKQVPAKTGILIMAPEGEYPVPTASISSVYANMFRGTLEGTTIQTHEEIDGKDYINYYLSSGASGVGFYRVTKEEGVTIGANRCYLPIKNKEAAGTRSANSDLNQIAFEEADEVIGIQLLRGIGGDEDGTTSIREVKSGEVKGEEWYTLQGQRVAKPGKGLYIHNGRKVVIK